VQAATLFKDLVSGLLNGAITDEDCDEFVPPLSPPGQIWYRSKLLA